MDRALKILKKFAYPAYLVTFFRRFRFDPESVGTIGVELEFYLVNKVTGKPVPLAPEFLTMIDDPAWTYELSRCQVEVRIGVCRTDQELLEQYMHKKRRGDEIAAHLGCKLMAVEAWQGEIPLEVYPTPRYLRLTGEMKWEKLNACCRAAGTHIHIGAGSWEQAIEMHTRLVRHLDVLLAMGDHSNGERIHMFKTWINPNVQPPIYRSKWGVLWHAIRTGWVIDLRHTWIWIRIARHGTVEVRVFGASDDINEILFWVRQVKRIALENLPPEERVALAA